MPGTLVLKLELARVGMLTEGTSMLEELDVPDRNGTIMVDRRPLGNVVTRLSVAVLVGNEDKTDNVMETLPGNSKKSDVLGVGRPPAPEVRNGENPLGRRVPSIFVLLANSEVMSTF